MEPIATSLWGSFRRFPPEAVPAMLDCILASTGSSPSSLFSSLLNEFPSLTKEITEGTEKLDSGQRNHIGSYVAALCHLLKKSDEFIPATPGSNNNAVRLFLWRILIPLMELIHAYDQEILDEAASLFLDVVTETNNWDIVEAIMVPLLLRSIGLSMGMLQSEELAIYEWGSKSIVQGSGTQLITPELLHSSHDKLTDVNLNNDSIISLSYYFPLPLSCHILSLILNAALQSKHVSRSASVSILANGSREKIFAGNMLWDLSNMTLEMLAQSMEHRSSAIRFLLPFIFKAFACNRAFEVSFHGKSHILTREHLFVKVWKCCKTLFSLGPLERRDAYNILSLYLSFSSFTDGHEDVNGDDREETFDLRDDREFWVEIKRGLLDKESLVRKLSLHILKTTLNLNLEGKSFSGVPEEVSDESWQRWEAFVFLYQMLEEYGTHLVEAAWNHQITLLLRPSFSLDNKKNSCNGEIHLNQMETFEEICEWLAVLLERGFCHDNPQVRCIIMQSFLALKWTDYRSSINLVPEDFILGPFIQGLNDPVHHKDFGVKGVYSSWAIEAAAKFLSQFTSYMDGRKHISFLVNLSSVSKKYSFGRAGLMCLAECIASSACGILKHNDHESGLCIDAYPDKILAKSGPENSSHNDKADLLDVLRFILECSKQHFNPNYRHQVCEKILAAADSVMSSLDVPREMLLHFISSLPREFTDYGGSLRSKVKKWLLKCDEAQLLKTIGGFPKSFISCHLPVDSLLTYDDDDLAAWGSEAKRWTRVLFLVIEEEEHLDPIIAFIQDHGSDVCKQNNLEWLPVKFFILLSSLVQELQVIKDRTADCHLTRRMKTETEIPGMVDSPSFVKETIIFEKFTKLLISLLAELVLYAKSSCSIFWSTVVAEDGILPGSITGRLGGPSQRRLSSSVGTSVLQAVTSLKTLASVTRWCAQNGTDASLNFSLTCLWNFCWKVITSSTFKSETDSEICIAAYEAFAFILKDLAFVFSLSLDLLMKTGSSSPLDADRKPVLDIFLSTFIQNINNLVARGNLARTRRAILMNWKWSCLESLLTMPNYALRDGVHMKSCRYYFSDTIIRWMFGDLVESLENAGEVSVLHMLRSVRLTMELFASGRMDSVVSSCEGINSQMMWQLVHSSWILHVSCNKRRVAPIAALLSSVLHYSVFGDEGMHEIDNTPGPLNSLMKILEEGTKSPRTIRLAALHLTGLWLANPITIKFYMKELKLLTLYGSGMFRICLVYSGQCSDWKPSGYCFHD
ncbi:tRNA/rRNA methyltransferase (SpoU) family protein [Forsythia ovata]|uniref:tRNA/rRNA methyltransferase (SpoU) family protein n=1 Tax=Forsythia ovata TaxID=205694 RepID=A0ABD1WEC8_9LAMI